MRRNLLPILMSMVLLSPLAIDIYLPSMPTMAAEFAVSASEVQSTLVLFLFAMGLGKCLLAHWRTAMVVGLWHYLVCYFTAQAAF